MEIYTNSIIPCIHVPGVHIHVAYMGITEYKIMDLNVHNHVLHFQYVPKHDSTLEFVSSTVDLATTMHCKYI